MRALVVSHAAVMLRNQDVVARLSLGHDVCLVRPRSWRNEYAPDGFDPVDHPGFAGTYRGVRVLNAGSVNGHVYLGRTVALVRRWKPDVIYLEEESYSLAALQWAVAARVTHTPIVFYSAQNILKAYPAPYQALERRLVWGASAGAHAVTDEVAEVLRRRGFEGPITVLPLPVNVHEFRPAVAVDHRLGDTGLSVGYVGRFVEEKGLRALVAAVEALRAEDGMDVRLVAIGAGPLTDLLESSDAVEIRTQVARDDVPAQIRAFDVLVLPSETQPHWKEQFGRVLVEAMASGVAVVGSDSGSIPGLIRQAGAGDVFPEGDAQALRGVLRALLRDGSRRRALGEAGRRVAERQYSVEAVGEGFAAMLAEASRV